MNTVFLRTIGFELLIATRHRGQWLYALLFCLLVIALFVIGAGASPEILKQIGPGSIWVTVILASLLSLERGFRADFEEGILEQWLLMPYSLAMLMLSKCIAHWLINLLPIVLLAPVMGYALNFEPPHILVTVLVLLLGTPILSLVGAIGVLLTLAFAESGLLLSLLLLPLYVPILVLGASAIEFSMMGIWPASQLALLGAILILCLLIVPRAAAYTLKMSFV
jgi:heme exporter protein B